MVSTNFLFLSLAPWRTALQHSNSVSRWSLLKVTNTVREKTHLKFCLLFLTAGMLQKRTCTVYNCSHIKQANKKSSPRSQLYGISLSDFDTNKSMLLKFQFPSLLPTEIENASWLRIKFRDFHFLLDCEQSLSSPNFSELLLISARLASYHSRVGSEENRTAARSLIFFLPWRIFVFPELWRSCDAQQWLHYDTTFFQDSICLRPG